MLVETIEVQHGALQTVLTAGDPGKGVNFTGYQEFGTTKHDATPFMGPAQSVMERSYRLHAEREVRRSLGR